MPPSRRSLHNSTRTAPPRSAATADATESTQTSMSTGSVIFPREQLPLSPWLKQLLKKSRHGNRGGPWNQKEYTRLICNVRAYQSRAVGVVPSGEQPEIDVLTIPASDPNVHPPPLLMLFPGIRLLPEKSFLACQLEPTLNNSSRYCRFCRSVMAKFLLNARSRSSKYGPRRLPFRESPYVPGAGVENTAVLNHSAGLRLNPLFGSPS